MRILHLSDTHFFASPDERHYGRVDVRAALDDVLARADDLGAIDVVVLSGDLSDDGTAESYRALQAAIEPWARRLGAREVVYAYGNHDGPGFDEVLGARRRVVTVGGWRIIVLDTSVAMKGYGELDAGQLDWLREQLGTPAERGTIVVMHHPPVPASTPLLQALELRNPDALAAAIVGTDVALILSGHYHHPVFQRFHGIPVVVAPGVANTTDSLAPAGHERAVAGGGFVTVVVDGDHPPRAQSYSARQGIDDGTVLFDLDELEVLRIAEAFGAPRP
ncbi:metallophosphoesterase [Gryllotalpicola sp.]|uniref:metallophosphoesterase n=1 Tax=Gryllotalpicola sp. TaxID=1932787 RepID=UPI002639FDB1|nr:metallophosphoesterase [Gryllotalpicola sp.]